MWTSSVIFVIASTGMNDFVSPTPKESAVLDAQKPYFPLLVVDQQIVDLAEVVAVFVLHLPSADVLSGVRDRLAGVA